MQELFGSLLAVAPLFATQHTAQVTPALHVQSAGLIARMQLKIAQQSHDSFLEASAFLVKPRGWGGKTALTTWVSSAEAGGIGARGDDVQELLGRLVAQ
jgi:hypothetical protein